MSRVEGARRRSHHPRRGAGMTLATAAASAWRELFCGVDREVPVAGGGTAPYVNLDNAASTPPLRAVRDAVHALADWYSSVHRGTGYKSLVSTHLYESARERVARFVGADPATQSVVFVKTTTEATNHVAGTLARTAGGTVLTTVMEHHANLLPWRHRLECVVTGVGADGRVDLEAMERALADHRGAITLVAVSGASNVTGLVTPIHDVAELAHRHGARILVDAAQLAPHRRIDMRSADDPRHIDFLAFSAHKLYAPYGCGVLVGPRDFFTGMPEVLGGGAVDVVTPDDTVWAAMPDREEAGSPNVVGAVALAVAIDAVEAMGLDAVEDHEVGLARCVEAGLRGVPGARVVGPPWRDGDEDRLGLLSIDVEGVHHSLLAAAMSWEWGIGVRHGCFCAHPYIEHLLGLSEQEVRLLRAAVIGGDRSRLPGAVRVSFAPYNTEAEAELVVRAVTSLTTEGPRAEYVRDAHGDFRPAGGWPALPDLTAILPA